MPGVVGMPPPPIFVDTSGQLMEFEAPDVGAPENVVQGEAMDMEDGEAETKGIDEKMVSENDTPE